MPSRCANTGTRASACTRATRLLPPRGTMTSMLPSRPASISADRGAVARRHELDRVLRQAGSRRPCDQRSVDRARGAEALRAAAQDRGVAGLQAQRAGIGGDVGAALVDHADDAERRAHALDGQAVRPLPARRSRGRPDRAEPRIVSTPSRHRLDARRRQRQPVEEGGGRAAGLRTSATSSALAARIAAHWRGSRAAHRVQRRVLLLRRRQRQHARGGAGAAADVGHQVRRSAEPSMVLSGAVMASQVLS